MNALIDFKNVGKVYEGRSPVVALKNVTFSVRKGDYVAIMGPSGSGKSTLLNVIGMLDQPTSGNYLLNGTDITKFGDDQLSLLRAHFFAFVFQAFHLIPYRTCVENVILGMLYKGVGINEAHQRACDALDQVGLIHKKDVLPAELSGGQCQRIAIARGIASHSDVLLCDEPSGNLDAETSFEILDLLQRISEQGQTILLITHEHEVAKRADRLLWIEDGVLAEKVHQ